jgi:hypothetical protein
MRPSHSCLILPVALPPWVPAKLRLIICMHFIPKSASHRLHLFRNFIFLFPLIVFVTAVLTEQSLIRRLFFARHECLQGNFSAAVIMLHLENTEWIK